jgi:UDP-N-acetylglucosamine diphosphorylase / glucose-1-phosphate thymidylyltransferase / UDP-N-acetylgalactosamine diphosphorylase / glucosamine-1-phosphate N-acetyltransferase / galactosamine-1-phosphate N-acetyltransferase
MAQKPVLIILAGGSSSRMWPLREKSLLRFGTQPLLISQLQRYRNLDFEHAIIVANPGNKADITALTANLARSFKLDIVVQNKPIGMGDALLQAEPVLAHQPETPVYVVQVHDVVEDSLHESMLRQFQSNPQETLLAGYEVEEYFPGGYLRVDDQDRITGIVEKPGAENRPSNLVNIVAHIHSSAARLFDAIRDEYARDVPGDDHYERAMDRLMKEISYRVVRYPGFWSALKYPWHVLDIMDYFLGRIQGQVVAEDALIAPGATLVGNVFIGAGAKVFPGAAVVGPAYIGAETIVGNNALVRNSMVLNHCEVGFTTEIARSYVSDNCSMHACRVLDSVFAQGVNFSAGCTTANLRIDRGDVPSSIKGERINSGRSKLGAIIGRDAFLAVDVMTMPGVKIGERAKIGPGTHVYKDVRNGQRMFIRQEVEVIDDDD